MACENKNCCCKCIHQRELRKHPWNENFGKGSISEGCGWACTVTFGDGSNAGLATYFDREHGECELFTARGTVKIPTYKDVATKSFGPTTYKGMPCKVFFCTEDAPGTYKKGDYVVEYLEMDFSGSNLKRSEVIGKDMALLIIQTPPTTK